MKHLSAISFLLLMIVIFASCNNTSQTDISALYDEQSFALFIDGEKILREAKTPEDYKKGIDMLQASFDQGFVPAAGALGRVYGEGKGVKQNPGLALKYFETAALYPIPQKDKNLSWILNEIIGSQIMAGAYYSVHDAIPLDRTKAYMWMKIAKYNASRPLFSDVKGLFPMRDDILKVLEERSSIKEKSDVDKLVDLYISDHETWCQNYKKYGEN